MISQCMLLSWLPDLFLVVLDLLWTNAAASDQKLLLLECDGHASPVPWNSTNLTRALFSSSLQGSADGSRSEEKSSLFLASNLSGFLPFLTFGRGWCSLHLKLGTSCKLTCCLQDLRVHSSWVAPSTIKQVILLRSIQHVACFCDTGGQCYKLRAVKGKLYSWRMRL